MKNRLKNIYLWLGIIGVVLVQLGLSDAHSWSEIGTVLCHIAQDPSRLLVTSMLLIGIFVDPSTPGFRDVEKLEDKLKK